MTRLDIREIPHTLHTIPMDYETTFKAFQNMEKYGGKFCEKLAQAWYAADSSNKKRIENAFSEYVTEFGPEGIFWRP